MVIIIHLMAPAPEIASIVIGRIPAETAASVVVDELVVANVGVGRKVAHAGGVAPRRPAPAIGTRPALEVDGAEMRTSSGNGASQLAFLFLCVVG